MEPEKAEFKLHSLCSTGTLDSISNHLKKDNSDINQYDKRGYAPIHYCMGRDSMDIEPVVSLLSKHAADVNLRTLREGDTPLHIAVARFDGGDAMTLALKLLSLGADPDYRNDSHRTAYDIAMAKGNVQLAELFTSEIEPKVAETEFETKRTEHKRNKLISVIMGEGTLEDVESCLQQGADPNYVNELGAGAIHYTITHSPLPKKLVLLSLLNAGADINLLTYENDTALNLVIKSERLRADNQMYELAEVLVECGSTTSQTDWDGKDAKTLARERKYDDIVSLLLTNTGTGVGPRPTLHKRTTKQIELSARAKFD